MIFEFLIVYSHDEDEIRSVLVERLTEVLEDNSNDFDDESIARMIRPSFRRAGPEREEGMEVARRVVQGFALDLPDEATSPRLVIDRFADSLREPPIDHVVKFEDPLLQRELADYAAELFALEMKLRRALSAIYLAACGDRYFDVLRDETVKPMNPPQEAQMAKVVENPFFHLTFGQYVKLNQRPEVTQLPKLLELVRSHESFDALKQELSRKPVEHEDDAGFIKALTERMDSIEKMRNCVAHNRRPPTSVSNNYRNARPQLDEDLERFLARWAAS